MSSPKKKKKAAEAPEGEAPQDGAPLLEVPLMLGVDIQVTAQTVRGQQEQKVRWHPGPKQPFKLLPVSFTVPQDAKNGDVLRGLKGRVIGPPEDPPPPPPASRLGGPEEDVWVLRDQFRFRRLPWWVVFALAIYAVLKVYSVYDSPCAVLGVPSPAHERQVKKAYRKLSTCTHPDRLVGKDADEQHRGETLFTRATEARDELDKWMKEGGRRRDNCDENPQCEVLRAKLTKTFAKKCDQPLAKLFRDGPKTDLLKDFCPCSCAIEQSDQEAVEEVSCYPNELEVQIYQLMEDLPIILSQASGQDVWAMLDGLKAFFLGIVTLESGVTGSISSLLLLSMLWRIFLSPLLGFFYKGHVFQSVVSVPTAIVFAPLPTAYRLVMTPFMRWAVFLKKEMLPLLKRSGVVDDENEQDDEEQEGEDAPSPKPERVITAKDHSASSSSGMEAKLKNRKKGPTTRSKAAAEIQKENNLLGKGIGGTKLGANEEADEDEEDAEDDGTGGESGEAKPVSANQKSLRELIERRPPRLSKEEEESMVIHTGQKIPTKKSKWRQLGASTIKFEFVLTLTKNIVPLIMILVMGEPMNGLMVSMGIGYVIRNYIPEMRIETLHIWLLFAGYFHTTFGQRAGSVEAQAEQSQVITLEWDWGFRDTLALANVLQLGATFAAASQCGNEPGFVTTFAAGVALRYQTYRWTAKLATQIPGVDQITEMLPANIAFGSLDDVAAQSGGGIGDCGGGPFRMLFGDYASSAALCVRLALLVLPLLHATMWTTRFLRYAPQVSHRKYRAAVLERGFLALTSTCQVVFLLMHNFNGIQGNLAGFWFAALIAAFWESLLSTYDVRGNGRQLLYLIIFIFL